MLMLANAFMQPPRTTLKPHAIAARRPVSLTAAPNDEIDVQRTLATLIAAQVVLFVGVGAVIPVVAIYGRETLGLSAAASGVVVSAPALALLLGALLAQQSPLLLGLLLLLGGSRCCSPCGRRVVAWS